MNSGLTFALIYSISVRLCKAVTVTASAMLLSWMLLPRATAQSTDQAQPALERRIQLVLRSQMNVPTNWKIETSNRSASLIAGFDTINVLFISDDASHSQQSIPFLISKDNTVLARLSEFSLTDIPGASIDTSGRPAKGGDEAPVDVIVFVDFECPFSAKLHADLFPEILSRYQGKLRIVYKDFPLTQIHPWALHAAENANCLGQQDKKMYWNYVDFLYSHQEKISGEKSEMGKSFDLLDQAATQAGEEGGANMPLLKSCMAHPDEGEIQASITQAESLNVDSTPTLFINGERLSGYKDEADLKNIIDRAISAGRIPAVSAQVADPKE